MSLRLFARVSVVGTLLLSASALSLAHGASPLAHAQGNNRVITISASHPSFPHSIAAGKVTVRVMAGKDMPLGAGFARIHAGVSMAQIGSAGNDITKLSRLVTFVGGVLVSNGDTGTVALDLRTPGQYGLHLQQGDEGPVRTFVFSVTPAPVKHVIRFTGNLAVTMRGTHFQGLPSHLRAGRISMVVSNRSAAVGKLLLFRLDAGKTIQDFRQAVRQLEAGTLHSDPTWVHDVGGSDLLSPQQTVAVTAHLTPGYYVADCPMPDPAHHGTPLDLEGMLVAFTVS